MTTWVIAWQALSRMNALDVWTRWVTDDDLGLGRFDLSLRNLAIAAQRSPLGELWPFTSMARLCVGATPTPSVDPLPGFIEFDADGAYRVFEGGPHSDHRCIAECRSPEDAVGLLERLLGL